MSKRIAKCMVVWMLVALIGGAMVYAAPVPDDAVGKVILPWETFQKILKDQKAKGEPKITLPWAEVEDMLGVKVNKFTGPELSITWKQFKTLLQWSVAQKDKDKPKKPLPAEYIILSTDTVGTLREKGAEFEMTVKVNVLREEGWKRIRVLPAGVAVSSAKLPAGCYLNVSGGSYEMLTQKKGELEAVLKFAVAVRKDAGVSSTAFQTISSATSTLKLTVPGEKAEVTVQNAQATVPLKAKGKDTVVGVSLPSGMPVQIRWERALEKVVKAPTKLYADTKTLVAIGDGSMTCRAQVGISVLHTGIRSVALSVPADVSVLEVSGRSISDWNVEKGALAIRFSREVLGSNLLNIVYERTDAKTKGTQSVPLLHVVNVIRERGTIGVVALANVEITASKHTNATPLDVSELPVETLRMTSRPILLAFRYIGKQPELVLGVKKHTEAKVLLTLGDSALATIMQTDDGRRITKIIYNVRNNRNQFFRLRLPKGADVWTATVAGKDIRPAVDADGRVMIPLVRSAVGGASLAAFPVELVYVESEKVGKSGSMRISLPQSDQPVMHLMVQLYLPKDGDYTTGLLRRWSFEGPVRRVEKFTNVRSAPSMGDVNVGAAARNQKMQALANRQIAAQARAKGVKPLNINLPIRGQKFQFEKILVLEEALWINFKFSGWQKD
jgi:hypothetical protein